jgi:hypothetical protein
MCILHSLQETTYVRHVSKILGERLKTPRENFTVYNTWRRLHDKDPLVERV